MEFLYSLVLFILVLIIYSQLMYQLKKGDDMEIYEIDYTNNRELNESANLPIIIPTTFLPKVPSLSILVPSKPS